MFSSCIVNTHTHQMLYARPYLIHWYSANHYMYQLA